MKLFIERLGDVAAFIFLAGVFLIGLFIVLLGLWTFLDEFTTFAAYSFGTIAAISVGFWLITHSTQFIKWLIIEPIKQSRKGR